MTEFDKADLDKNGSIDRIEWNRLALEDRRLEMVDRDLKRNVNLSVYYIACLGARL